MGTCKAYSGTMSQIASQWPRRHRLSVADYYRMAEVGILPPDERTELIDGEIIDMPPPGSLHAGTVDYLLAQFRSAVGDTAIVAGSRDRMRLCGSRRRR